jgi:hypothetical protein
VDGQRCRNLATRRRHEQQPRRRCAWLQPALRGRSARWNSCAPRPEPSRSYRRPVRPLASDPTGPRRAAAGRAPLRRVSAAGVAEPEVVERWAVGRWAVEAAIEDWRPGPEGYRSADSQPEGYRPGAHHPGAHHPEGYRPGAHHPGAHHPERHHPEAPRLWNRPCRRPADCALAGFPAGPAVDDLAPLAVDRFALPPLGGLAAHSPGGPARPSRRDLGSQDLWASGRMAAPRCLYSRLILLDPRIFSCPRGVAGHHWPPIRARNSPQPRWRPNSNHHPQQSRLQVVPLLQLSQDSGRSPQPSRCRLPRQT